MTRTGLRRNSAKFFLTETDKNVPSRPDELASVLAVHKVLVTNECKVKLSLGLTLLFFWQQIPAQLWQPCVDLSCSVFGESGVTVANAWPA